MKISRNLQITTFLINVENSPQCRDTLQDVEIFFTSKNTDEVSCIVIEPNPLSCSVLQCHAVYCNVMQFTAMSCSILHCDAVSHGIVQVLRSAALLEAGTSWRRRASWTRRRGRGGRGRAGRVCSPGGPSGRWATTPTKGLPTGHTTSAETFPPSPNSSTSTTYSTSSR